MELREKVIDEISEVLEVLQFECSRKTAEEYIDDKISDKEFFLDMKEIDFSCLNEIDSAKVDSVLNNVISYKYEEKYLKKLIKIITQKGGLSSCDILERNLGYVTKDCINYYLNLAVEPYIVIYMMMNYINSNTWSYIDKDYLKILDKLVKEDRNSVLKAADYCSEECRIEISAVYCSNYDDNSNDRIREVEEYFIANLNNIYPQLSESTLRMMQDYVCNNTEDTIMPSKILIDKLKKYNYEDRIFQNYMSVLSFVLENSLKMRNLVRILTVIDCTNVFKIIENCHQENIKGTLKYVNEILALPLRYVLCYMAYKYKNNLKSALDEYAYEYEIDELDEAITISSGLSRLYLMSVMLESSKEELYKKLIEQEIKNVFYEEVIEYLEGKKSIEEIKKVIDDYKDDADYIRANSYILVTILKILRNKYGYDNDIYERTITVMLLFSLYEQVICIADIEGRIDKNILNEIYEIIIDNNLGIEKFIELTKVCGIPYRAAYNKKLIRALKPLLERAAYEHPEYVIKNIDKTDDVIKDILLNYIFVSNDNNRRLILTKISYDSKYSREKTADLFKNNPEYMDIVFELLNDKKQKTREAAVGILITWKNLKKEALDALKKIYENDKSLRIRNMIIKEIQDNEYNRKNDQGNKENTENHLKELVSEIKKNITKTTLKWIDFDKFSRIRFKEDGSYCDTEYMKVMLYPYHLSNKIEKNEKGQLICSSILKEDLILFSKELFQMWIDKGVCAQRKWVSAFCAINGDDELIEKIANEIRVWGNNSKKSMACDGITALSLNDSIKALRAIDEISSRFRLAQVKRIAEKALYDCAEKKGLYKEQLRDILIPDFGFDSSGNITFDYGKRKFKGIMKINHSIEIYDENNKKLSKLPVKKKDDDEVKVKEAQSIYKKIKKDIKGEAVKQILRIEEAVKCGRRWNKNLWRTIFIDNPMMHIFASTLVWGVYENKNLINTFRYMEDGTFNTKNEEEYDIPEESTIKLIHPVDLSAEDLRMWKEHLESYDIVQPVNQLYRTAYFLTEEEKVQKSLKHFGGTVIEAYKFEKYMTDKKWTKNFDEHESWEYYSLYKSYGSLTAEVSFNGIKMWGENIENITIYDVKIYKSENDNIRGCMLELKEVPEQFLSEIMLEISSALEGSSLKNTNWEIEADIG